MTCPITGEAELERTYGPTRKLDTLRWLRADPEIHVSNELLRNLGQGDAEFLRARYEIGEQCGWHPDTRHARMREDT